MRPRIEELTNIVQQNPVFVTRQICSTMGMRSLLNLPMGPPECWCEFTSRREIDRLSFPDLRTSHWFLLATLCVVSTKRHGSLGENGNIVSLLWLYEYWWAKENGCSNTSIVKQASIGQLVVFHHICGVASLVNNARNVLGPKRIENSLVMPSDHCSGWDVTSLYWIQGRSEASSAPEVSWVSVGPHHLVRPSESKWMKLIIYSWKWVISWFTELSWKHMRRNIPERQLLVMPFSKRVPQKAVPLYLRFSIRRQGCSLNTFQTGQWRKNLCGRRARCTIRHGQ